MLHDSDDVIALMTNGKCTCVPMRFENVSVLNSNINRCNSNKQRLFKSFSTIFESGEQNEPETKKSENCLCR